MWFQTKNFKTCTRCLTHHIFNCIILHHPSSSFIIFHHLSSSFIILHHPSSSFIILHHPSSILHHSSFILPSFCNFEAFQLVSKKPAIRWSSPDGWWRWPSQHLLSTLYNVLAYNFSCDSTYSYAAHKWALTKMLLILVTECLWRIFQVEKSIVVKR